MIKTFRGGIFVRLRIYRFFSCLGQLHACIEELTELHVFEAKVEKTLPQNVTSFFSDDEFCSIYIYGLLSSFIFKIVPYVGFHFIASAIEIKLLLSFVAALTEIIFQHDENLTEFSLQADHK